MSNSNRDVGELLHLEEFGDIAVIRLNRPGKKNAMNRAGRHQLLGLLRSCEHRFRVCILTGTGDAFCAGIDLKERQEDRRAGIESAPREWREVNLAVRRHPSVFIAAVNGYALGGGVTLINACDLAVASESVELALPEITFATYAGLAGPSTQLTVSRKRAAWLLLTGSRIGAGVARDWGLVNEVVPDGALMDYCLDLAKRVAKFDATALQFTKHALDKIPHPIGDWETALEYGELVNAHIRENTSAQVAGVEKFGVRDNPD